MLAAAGPVVASPSRASSSSDRASTYAFLSATYAFDRAVAGKARSSILATRRLDRAIAHGCPDVLAGTPQPSDPLLSGQAQTAEQQGVAQRQGQQLSAWEDELALAFTAAVYSPDRKALAAYRAATAALSWSDETVAEMIDARIAAIEALASQATGNICADARTWASSHFRRISQATHEAFQRFNQALEDELTGPLGRPSLGQLLAPYEHAPERDLIRRIEAAEGGGPVAQEPTGRSQLELLSLKLGLKAKRGREIAVTKLGGGRPLAGGRFTILVEHAREPESACRFESTVEYTPAFEEGLDTGSSGPCISPDSANAHASTVTCQGGTLTIERRTQPDAYSVRLRLSNGRSVTTAVVRVPKRLGGPAGIYYQALRGPRPYPISLSELDRQGRLLRTLKLQSSRDCKRVPVVFEHLAHLTTPAGLPLTITGTIVGAPGSAELGLLGGPEVTAEPTRASGHGSQFTWTLQSECPPEEYAVIYGQLRAPAVAVLARTAQGLVPLELRAIPPDLGSGTTLAYGLLPSVPSELIVEGAGGVVLATERPSIAPAERQQFCEGYAED